MLCNLHQKYSRCMHNKQLYVFYICSIFNFIIPPVSCWHPVASGMVLVNLAHWSIQNTRRWWWRWGLMCFEIKKLMAHWLICMPQAKLNTVVAENKISVVRKWTAHKSKQFSGAATYISFLKSVIHELCTLDYCTASCHIHNQIHFPL